MSKEVATMESQLELDQERVELLDRLKQLLPDLMDAEWSV